MVGLALNCIAYAWKPLTIMQLRELLSVPKKGKTLKPSAIIREGSITKYCSSLLRKSTDGSVLEFSHFSVLEFLEGNLTERSDLDEFWVSQSRAEVLMTIEFLKYLQLDNFKELPSNTETILAHMDELNEKFPLYRHAATAWLFHVYSHWENLEIISLAESLFFSPARTTTYTTWALAFTFDLGFMNFVPLSKPGMLDLVTHPTFTPLHMAASLSFPDICRHLLGHNFNPSIMSRVGSAMQCAVQGLWSFSLHNNGLAVYISGLDSAAGEVQPHIRYIDSEQPAIRDTLLCFQESGVALQYQCCSPFHGFGLLGVALRLARNNDTLFMPATLLSAGADLNEKDSQAAVELFEYFRDKRWTYTKERFLGSLLLFTKALDTLVDKSPAHHHLCSIARREATYYQLDFTSNPTAIDTKLDMSEQAIAVVKAGNVQMLKCILQQPHIEVANFEGENGYSLLHMAVEVSPTNHTLEIIELLLEAGCNVDTTNYAGEQPLHVWSRTKAHDLDMSRRTVQLLTERGSDCTHQDFEGRNILHLVIEDPDKLQIILKYQEDESITRAMESADAGGYTPFPSSLRYNYLRSAMIMMEEIEFTPAMVKSPEWPLTLAVRANSAEIFDFLLSSKLDISSFDEQGRNPLHFLTSKTTEAFLLRLKTLYPIACKSHGVDGPPIQVYLESCIKQRWSEFRCRATNFNTILSHLHIEDTPAFSMWEIFGSKLLPAMLASPSYMICEEAVTSFGTALLQLGYLESYESRTRKSGLFPLLESVSHASFHWAFPLTRQVMEQSGFWSEFHISQPAARLLKQTICENGLGLMEDLLKKGISGHQRVDGCSAMEKFVCQPPATPLEAKPVFEILLKYGDNSRINEPAPNGLALIHLPTTASEWMVDLLVEQGANPDLRTEDSFKQSALTHHLLNGRFIYASALFKNGADPCKANPAGWNAICAASYRGSAQFLKQIYDADELEKRIDWKHTCMLFLMNGTSFGGVNGLHLASHNGCVTVLKFYAEHNLLRDLDLACDSGLKPLHYAAMTDRLVVLNFLCREGCDPNAKSKDGKTALHLAAQYGHYKAVECLVQVGCTLSLDSAGLSPLFYAYQSNNKELIEYLQSRDSNSTGDALGDATIPGIASTLPGKAKAKALEDAIQQNSLTSCQKLHKNGCNLNTFLPSCGCCSPLILAIISQRFSIIEWLLDQQVLMSRPSCVGPDHSTALHLLIRMLTQVDPASKASVSDTLLPKGLQNYMEQGGTFLRESPGILRSMLETTNIDGLRVLVAHLKQNKRHYA